MKTQSVNLKLLVFQTITAIEESQGNMGIPTWYLFEDFKKFYAGGKQHVAVEFAKHLETFIISEAYRNQDAHILTLVGSDVGRRTDTIRKYCMLWRHTKKMQQLKAAV